MNVFRPTYRDRKGNKRETRAWHVEVVDRNGFRHRFAGFTDRSATAEFGRKLESLFEFHAAREQPGPELARWAVELPRSVLKRLVPLGVVAESRVNAGRPLSELLDEFAQALRARERTEKHVEHVRGRAGRAFTGAGFKTWSDLDAPALERHLHELRTLGRLDEDGEREKAISAKSSNHYLAAAKEFARWGVERVLGSVDPFRALRPLNARVDVRRPRRALTADELRAPIRSAQSGQVILDVPGPVRA